MSEKVSMMKGMTGHGAYMLIRMFVSEPHEIEELMQAWRIANTPQPEPDMFWPMYDADGVSAMDLQHLIDEAEECGDLLEVNCAKSLPSRKIRAWCNGEDEKQHWEWVD